MTRITTRKGHHDLVVNEFIDVDTTKQLVFNKFPFVFAEHDKNVLVMSDNIFNNLLAYIKSEVC